MRRVCRVALCVALSLTPLTGYAQTDPAAPVEASPATPEPAVVVEPQATPAQIQARIFYDQSRAHYAAGHYRAAARSLEEAVAVDPEGANLWYNLGNVCERLGNLERAEAAYRRYLERTRDPVEQERTRRILTRLEGARVELSSISTRRGRADGLFWALTGAAVGATGFGVAWLLSNDAGDNRAAPWGLTVGGLSLGVLSTVLYFAREAPARRSLLVDVSLDGRLSVRGTF